ncbi:MAG: sigma 54-interacting transcriptional regulator [Nannocystaceae bacterium]
MPHPSPPREAEELSLLFDVSRALKQSLDLREVLGPVMEQMARRLGLRRGTLSLVDPENEQIRIEFAPELTAGQRRLGKWSYGEGITGEVIRSGVAVIVPHTREDARLVDRTGARTAGDDVAHVCVPIQSDSRTIGALSADREPRGDGNVASLGEDARLLSIIASLIGEAVRLRQAAHVEARRRERENARLQAELRTRLRPTHIIGSSKTMLAVFELVAQVSGTATTVLVLGESGTGKELLASALHRNSPRNGKAFVKVNCASLPESIIESELFGHERGAFTGAVNQRKGRFELAHDGTLFLDEIGEMSAHMQAKLLRVLQERELERVGGTKTIRVDVRVVAATNQDLEARIAGGSFRADLFYRLNVFPIRMPALRERRSDILLLADHFVTRFNGEHGRAVKRISTPAIDTLMAYHWPGNVRELENCIERAVLLSQDRVIHAHSLPPSLQTAQASGTSLQGSLQRTLEAVERELVLEALKETRGNMADAARRLGITERIMGLRIRKYRMDAKRFRRSGPSPEGSFENVENSGDSTKL